MSLSDYVRDATKLQTIQARAIIQGDRFQSRALYTMKDKPGIWRRVSREGRHSLKKVGDGNILVCDDEGDILELARYDACELEIPTLSPGAMGDKSGLWRRVSREGRHSLKKVGDGNILVCDDEGELEIPTLSPGAEEQPQEDPPQL